MTLKSTYERFLSSPNPLSLSEKATLHYVTTLTSYAQQGPIIRHLETQNRNVVKKKTEKVISVVEGHSSIAIEVETTLEFISSGGAYLPGLDDFIVDRTAILPITHIVHFDKDGKITQIRLNWDQGSLLRQVEVIGSRGKNWPVFDGKDHIKMITSSSNNLTAIPALSSTPRGRTDDYQENRERIPSPSKRFVKDPHASLDVFEPPKEDENRRPATADSQSVAPRESARPPPREYSEMFAAGNEDLAPSPNGSPNKVYKENIVAPKGAGARKFEGSRLFEEDQDFQEPKIYKTNPSRYNHFDIGDPDENDAFQHKPNSKSEHKNVPLVARTKKHGSQWNFEDFVTPEKVPQRYRQEDQVHFSFEEQGDKQINQEKNIPGKSRKDTESHFDFLDDGTPVQRLPAQPKARKDAELHFEFRDDPTPAPRRIIARTKAAAGIYSNPLDAEDDESDRNKAPLSTITNNAGRRREFDSHWDRSEDSSDNANNTRKAINESKAKIAAKSMNADWDAYDQPIEGGKKSTAVKNRPGMTSSWSFQDEQEESRPARNGRRQDKGVWDF